MWMPPIFVRRVFIDPLIFLGSIAAIIVSPIALAVAFVADLVSPGHWKALRVTGLVMTFLLYEVLGLVAALALWLASGFGLWIRKPGMVKAHHQLLGWWINGISRAVQKAFGLTIALPDQPTVSGPLIVFSRHAGTGDSVFLVGVLLGHFGRFPRIVGKKELEFAPFFDIMGHRLPMRFIRPHPKRQELALEAVRDAASDLGPHDAFVLFPEGGNFTPNRRERAIESLRRHGYGERAEAAQNLEHLPLHTRPARLLPSTRHQTPTSCSWPTPEPRT
jgi:1-acyl-sn-glycerol-3-phosphate acyltransferase